MRESMRKVSQASLKNSKALHGCVRERKQGLRQAQQCCEMFTVIRIERDTAKQNDSGTSESDLVMAIFPVPLPVESSLRLEVLSAKSFTNIVDVLTITVSSSSSSKFIFHKQTIFACLH